MNAIKNVGNFKLQIFVLLLFLNAYLFDFSLLITQYCNNYPNLVYIYTCILSITIYDGAIRALAAARFCLRESA